MQSISKIRQAIIDQLRRGVPNVSADSVDANAVETGELDTGRSWQNMTVSRSFNTDETNNTDSEIKVAVRINVDSTGHVLINGESGDARVDRVDTEFEEGDDVYIQIISVVPGDTYSVNSFGDASVSINTWNEFRT